MNGTERIRALLRQEPIDRSPIGGWFHMPLEDHSLIDFTLKTINTTEFFGWDFVKVMPNGHYIAEAYGADMSLSTDPRVWSGTIHRYPVRSIDDLRELPVLDAKNPTLAREIEAARILSAHYKGNKPVIGTVFNPLTSIQEIISSLQPAQTVEFIERYPKEMHRALDVMHRTNINYVDGLLGAGVDGIFLANQFAMNSILNTKQYDEFCKPYEDALLEHIRDKTWFNVVHLHGNAGLRFDRYHDAPAVQAFSWECCPKGYSSDVTTSIGKVAREFPDKIIISGIDQRSDFITSDNNRDQVKQTLARRYREALREKGDNRFVFAPGCGLLLPTPSHLFHIIREVVEEYEG